MELGYLKQLLNAEVLTPGIDLETPVKYMFGCDLMSDVLALVNRDCVLLTGLTNIQSVRTAEMVDVKCIIYVRGKKPDSSVIDLAGDKDICLMTTKHTMFTSCGILYSNGMRGIEGEDG
jgi:predicted transcriptional regulator